MLAREGWLGVPIDLLQEQVVPAKVEGVAVAVADLMVPVRRVHDESGDTLGVEGAEARHHNAPVKGPVRGDATRHEGVVVISVEDGVSVEPRELDTDHGKATIIAPVEGNAKGVVGHGGISFLVS